MFRCYKAIRKYGEEAFVWAILGSFETHEAAKRAEIDYISANNPEYNATKGGDGSCGPMSIEGRERIRNRHTGNTYRLGAKHTDKTKNRLRQVMLENPDHWEKYRKMGPVSQAKKVVCLNTGDVFESASSAARFAGCSKSMVIELCNGSPRRKSAGGYVFKYEEAA